ncbi:hypothetical protein ACFY2R_24675 [Micromonospora olivasterospora]|uniref:Uncharacterized protein n=1 Tax=Micromonospora olivasterospora TaxID=1880 RepID=A0A562I8Y6_MICOL|nr:hypothetical protein [Micromonospora olivasterospora]TWH67133.1 hypothetical protein JD77_02102 [Micromonospora olivasterospora]
MTALTRTRKAWRPVLIGALALAGMATTATPASAATTNRTGLCNKSTTYSSTLEFPSSPMRSPSRGAAAQGLPAGEGFSSPLVAPGKCWSIELRAGSTQTVQVYAHRNGSTVRIGSWTIKTGAHNVFRTYGTICSPSLTYRTS